MSGNKNYMSMDAWYTYCDHGSDKQKVYLEESHGVINQKDKKPVLNANDYKYPDNIKGYGKCKAKGKHLVLSRRWRRKKPGDVIGVCRPELHEPWKDCDPHYTIEGAPVVLDTSCLHCARGGVIRFMKPDAENNMKDADQDEYSSFAGFNKTLQGVNEAIVNCIPDNMKTGDNNHLLKLGTDEFGAYIDLSFNALDVDNRETELKKDPTDGWKLEHGNATQVKVNVELGGYCKDLSASVGTELEVGKIKSGSKEPEPADLKVYGKASVKDKGELEASKHLLEDKVEATFEAGKAKLSAEKSKGKYGASISVRDKQD
ncbi:hypothetical protein SELR_08390 [Selenomonas ruminantium subsp. lactilytica TAM6421]|uniref:DUF4280 domain-containing protein n=1 Tax=Selenomonas ruminantium subsp. lactilytica (strain NBRC 103574 / TAM6421) TaxID=927704 RepID=I0GP60_SELRL|nr:PAAR-like protein [Selenomonas ruminantium]BAL82547.1 hypothetical protein SELR_08390 [Selenomonas ruminantium subsp. lactilytica TAM6421]